jgi:hypothetical protein
MIMGVSSMRKAKHRTAYVWPDLVIKEFLTAVALTIILLVWALLINAPLMEVATPGISENPSKAPWYFVGLQELLVYFDPWVAGVMIPAIIIICLVLIPYLDSNPQGKGAYTFSERKFVLLNFIFGFTLWWVLILIGYVLRGPNWQLYWPWESWDTIKEIDDTLWSLKPREGVTVLALYFGGGLIIPRIMKRNQVGNFSLLKYSIIVLSLLLMYAVPIKIILRLAFDIKYVLVTPWLNI